MTGPGVDRLTLPRPWGVTTVRIVDTPFDAYVDLVARKLDGDEKCIAVKVDELDALITALRDCQRVLCGDPKHAPKGVDPVFDSVPKLTAEEAANFKKARVR